MPSWANRWYSGSELTKCLNFRRNSKPSMQENGELVYHLQKQTHGRKGIHGPESAFRFLAPLSPSEGRKAANRAISIANYNSARQSTLFMSPQKKAVRCDSLRLKTTATTVFWWKILSGSPNRLQKAVYQKTQIGPPRAAHVYESSF